MPAVLVVETDHSLGSLLTVLLEREGFVVDLLPHGTAALRVFEKLECREYAAIVVQVTPLASPVDRSVSTGVALLRELQRRSPDCFRKTFVLTTLHDQFIAELAKVCRVISEPFDIHEFAKEIRSCVSAGGVSAEQCAAAPPATERGNVG